MKIKKKYRQIFQDLFQSIDIKDKQYLPTEYAEEKRMLTSDVSSIQGKFKYDFTPYLKEIVNCLSPYNPVKIIIVKKGAQVGMTEGVIVNGILWIIANNPGNILTLSANDDLSKEMVESRLDQGIDSCGLRSYIRPNTIRKRNQRTGDTSQYKEFAGGRMFAGGLNSINKLGKQRSIKYGFFDDWDAAKVSDKEQGSLFDLIQQRFSTNYYGMKQFFISTPQTKPSNIDLIYKQGDQRKWHVPCPKCGQYIELVWNQKDKDGNYVGVLFDLDENNNLIHDSVRYKCQKCGEEFTERHKYKMNLKGKWIATAKPERPYMRSYHLSCLPAAPNMYDWTHYAYQYADIFKNGKANQNKLKVFMNVVLGEAWEQKKKQVAKNKLIQNCREYEINTVPNSLSNKDGNGDILLLTCACDLNGTIDDARLDYEVVGHAASGSMYSITHGSIGTYYSGKDKTGRDLWTYKNEEKNNVWDYLYKEIISRDYFTDNNRKMRIMMTGIDTGYYTHFAYHFIDSYPGIVTALKGDVSTKLYKVGKDAPKFKPARERPNLFILQTDLLKDELADMIQLEWTNTDLPQPAGFVNFPTPVLKEKKYDNYYFKQYEAEEKVIETDDDGEPVGWKWMKKGRSYQNHFWDTAVYNLALRQIVSTKIMKEIGKKYASWADFADVISNMLK